MTKTKFEPVPLYVDQAAIEKERSMVEEYLDFINNFADELAKDDVILDEKLLNEFAEKGHEAIYFRIMEDSKKDKSLNLLSAQINAGAQRIAAKFSNVLRNLNDKQVKTGLDLSAIVILNGRAVPRGNVLQEIIDANTITLKSPEVQELHKRLTSFTQSYNELQKYIKEVHPECEDLKANLITGMTEQHYFMGKINREDCYMVVEPYTSNLEPDLVVNPLFFKNFK